MKLARIKSDRTKDWGEPLVSLLTHLKGYRGRDRKSPLCCTAAVSDPPGTGTELSAHGIVVRFDGLTAISDASLTVRPKEILGVIGPNGAGKTTLVNCLTGYQKPTSGDVTLAGASTSDWSPEQFRKRGVARTFQAGRLFRELTVFENVEVAALGLGLSRKQARKSATEILQWVGLARDARRTAGALPYTDERRLGIARALVSCPSFVLLDEPAAGMSDAECDDLNRHIRRIPADFGCGVLLIDHNMSVVMNVCDRIHVLDGGSTIAEGTPREICSNELVINAYLGNEA